MAGSDVKWSELSSQNERVIERTDPAAAPSGCPSGTARSRWAALASQRERLVDPADPEFQLATPGHGGPGLRLVAGAA